MHANMDRLRKLCGTYWATLKDLKAKKKLGPYATQEQLVDALLLQGADLHESLAVYMCAATELQDQVFRYQNYAVSLKQKIDALEAQVAEEKKQVETWSNICAHQQGHLHDLILLYEDRRQSKK